jgi:hypothetical protein
MSLSVLVQPRVPRAAFGKIVRNEARLAGRQSSGLIVGVGIPLALLNDGPCAAAQTSASRMPEHLP